MSRPEKKIEDIDTLYDLLEKGMTKKEISTELGISAPTLSKRIAEIQSKQGLLLKYRDLQNLQLTELQARILEAITPEKIENASLSELVAAFRILKDKELVSLGQPNEIKGLVGYLVALEKESSTTNIPVDITALQEVKELQESVAEAVNITDVGYLPEL